MPGRNANEAVDSFLTPIQQAIGALGIAKVTVEGSRPYQVGGRYVWRINEGRGVTFPHGGQRFFAAMWWEIVEDTRPGYGPVRVTTTGYDYSLLTATGLECWALHWAPNGRGDVDYPHLHLGSALLSESAPIAGGHHLGTPRYSLEHALRWCVECGVVPLHRSDWADRLALAETPHLLYRTWSEWANRPLDG